MYEIIGQFPTILIFIFQIDPFCTACKTHNLRIIKLFMEKKWELDFQVRKLKSILH